MTRVEPEPPSPEKGMDSVVRFSSGGDQETAASHLEEEEPPRASRCQLTRQAMLQLGEAMIPQVVGAVHVALRLFWLVAYVILMAVFMLQMVTLVNRYFQYPVSTLLSVTQAPSTVFPAVTFCNNNPIRKHAIRGTKNYGGLAQLDETVEFDVLMRLEKRDCALPCPHQPWKCLKVGKICDGKWDCSDGWDEGLTGNFTCDDYSRGVCLPGFTLCGEEEPICATPCDHYDDCLDGRDESDQPPWNCKQCGGQLNATENAIGQFASPNYPQNYPDFEECIWVITAPEGKVVELTFDDEFYIEPHDKCRYDKLQFYDGTNVKAAVIPVENKTKICGLIPPEDPVLSTNNSVTVKFKSDYYGGFVGFLIYFQAVDPPGMSNNRARREFSEAEPKLRRKKRTSDNDSDAPNESEAYNISSNYYDYYYDDYDDYGSDYSENYDYSSFDSYDDWYEAFDPYEQFANITAYDWAKVYRKSRASDYSDFKTFALLDRQEVRAFGSQPEDFIAQCTYDGRTCDHTDFETIQDPVYGNCFSFNSILHKEKDEKGEFKKIKSTSKTGAKFGLKVTLFIQIEDYIGVLGNEKGAQAMITGHSVMPIPENGAIQASAGQVTRVAISQKLITRQGGDYGNCLTEYPEELKVAEKFREQWPYTLEMCDLYCQQMKLLEICGCVDAYIAEYQPENEQENFPVCFMWSEVQRSCRTRFYKLVRESDPSVRCPCQVECRSTQYNTQITVSGWPSPTYAPYVVKTLKESSGSYRLQQYLGKAVQMGNTTKTELGTIVQDNFARVEVYFQNLNFEVIEEIPSYVVTNLVTDFGGNIGLWVGWSVLSMLELLVFLFKLAGVNAARTLVN